MSSADTRSLVIGVIGSLLAAGIAAGVAALSGLPSVPIPLWLLAAVIAAPTIWYGVRRVTLKRITVVANKKFSCERVTLDGQRFIECEFDRCILVFNGQRGFGFERCKFGGPTFAFESHAAITAYQLSLFQSDPAFHPVLTQILDPTKPKSPSVT